MAHAPTPEVGVGADFQSVYAWTPTPVTADEFEERVAPTLVGRHPMAKGQPFDIVVTNNHVEFRVPGACVNPSDRKNDMFAWTATVAGALDLRQIRYGHRAGKLFVGFNRALSEIEADVCKRGELYQYTGQKAITAASEPFENNDGSQTFIYKGNLARSGRERAASFRRLIMEEIGPNLEKGGAICDSSRALMVGEASLFTAPEPEVETVQPSKWGSEDWYL